MLNLRGEMLLMVLICPSYTYFYAWNQLHSTQEGSKNQYSMMLAEIDSFLVLLLTLATTSLLSFILFKTLIIFKRLWFILLD